MLLCGLRGLPDFLLLLELATGFDRTTVIRLSLSNGLRQRALVLQGLADIAVHVTVPGRLTVQFPVQLK